MSSVATLGSKPMRLAVSRSNLEEFDSLPPLDMSIVSKIPVELRNRYLEMRHDFHEAIMSDFVPYLTMPSRFKALQAGLSKACAVLEVRGSPFLTFLPG